MRLITVVLDNDAKAAYDQMIPSQCMITSARAGVPKGAIKLKLTALKRMKYFVKTAYGSSIRLHEHVPLLDTQTTPRKCSCWLYMGSQFFNPALCPHPNMPPVIFPSPAARTLPT